MRSILRLAVLTVLLAISATVFPSNELAEARAEFSDLHYSKWAAESIHYLADRGTVAGYGGGRFGPQDAVTRAQAVTYLVRELYPEAKAPNQTAFKDVPSGHAFYKEIAIASDKGLIGGFPDGTFRPGERISRAETTAILTRAYDIARGTESVELSDIEGNWAAAAIRLLASNKLVGGYSDQTFRPSHAVTRAEFAVFLTRVIKHKRSEAITRQDWDGLLSYMTLQEKVGQMLMPDIRAWNGKATTTLNEGIERTIKEHALGGLILFEKNISSIRQLTTFTDQLQKQAGDIPLLLGIDQEGGTVKRIPQGTNLPGSMALGAVDNAQLSYQAGSLTGVELKALGVNLNFAPVLDINLNPSNPVIGIRSFGSDPELVARLGIPFMKGLRDAGVISAVKHFPGHGDTQVDSHLGLPSLPHDRQRLEQVELKPFRAAIDEGVDMIMTAHVTFPAIDDSTRISRKDGTAVTLPATLSKKVLTGLLRQELGYDGVIITDAFTMNAIAEHFGEAEAVKLAAAAGADIILMPQQTGTAFQALIEAVQQGELKQQTIDASVRRILKLKHKYGLFAPEAASLQKRLNVAEQVVGSEAHREVQDQIALRAVTLLHNEKGVIPHTLQDRQRIVIVADQLEQAEQMKAQLAAVFTSGRLPQTSLVLRSELQQQSNQALIKEAHFVIAATYQNRSPIAQYPWAEWQLLIDRMNADAKPYVLLSLGNPYDMKYLKNVNAAIAVYGDESPNTMAALKVIFGSAAAEGKLPVTY